MNTQCGWDKKILGKSSSTHRGHSHKELMKCLYRSNVELFRANQIIQEQDRSYKDLQVELAKYIVKEQTDKENTGLMDVKEEINVVDAPPLNIGKDKTKNDKELAKDLLEAESVIDIGKSS